MNVLREKKLGAASAEANKVRAMLVSACTLHRFQDAVNLATFDLSASLIGNTFTLASDANINTNKNFRPDYRSGLLALLSRFSS